MRRSYDVLAGIDRGGSICLLKGMKRFSLRHWTFFSFLALFIRMDSICRSASAKTSANWVRDSLRRTRC